MPVGAWHRQRYDYWLSNGGKKPAYKENLCHYARVVLFKVTWMKFVRARLFGTVPLWTLPAAALAIAPVATLFYLWPHTGLVGLKWIGIIAGFILTVLIVLFAAFWLDETFPKKTKLIWKWGTSPIWIGPYLAWKGLKWMWSRIEKPVEVFIGWYVFEVYPLALTIAVPAVYSIYRWPYKWLAALEITGLLLLCVAVAIAVLLLLVLAQKGVGPIKETIKLGATYLDTKKKGSLICPFIEFEDAEAA
jgi:hypothetical protein